MNHLDTFKRIAVAQREMRTGKKVACNCDAYGFPHLVYSGRCEGLQTSLEDAGDLDDGMEEMLDNPDRAAACNAERVA